jgi:UV DNA damage endonuclease
VNNPSNIDPLTALGEFVVTWPNEQTPKIHFSSQRREVRIVKQRDRESGLTQELRVKAKPGQHDDWIDSEEFVALVDGARHLLFDVMLEAKQKQLALLRLREKLVAPGRTDLAW